MARPKRYKNNYASVTEIVDIIDKPGLRYWYGKFGTKECEKKKHDSARIGQAVHKAIEKFVTGVSFKEVSEGLTNDQVVMLSYLTDWCSRNKPKPMDMEEALYCKEYGFAGTPDLICHIEGRKSPVVVDWKTDSPPRDKASTRERHAKYLWQLSGYAIAYEEVHGVRIDTGIIVRAAKNLSFEEIKFSKLAEGKKEFKMLREIYKRIKGK